MKKGRVFNIQHYSLHDGPGIRTIVFLAGCPLSCVWCANPEARFGNSSKWMTTDEVMTQILKDELFYFVSGGGLTLSGGEAGAQFEFSKNLFETCKQQNISCALETSGYVNSKDLLELSLLCDVVLFDVKHSNHEIHKKQTGVDLKKILSNLCLLLDNNIPVLIRIPVIPKFNADQHDLQNIIHLIEELENKSLYRSIQAVELLPFHQLGKSKYKRLNIPYSLSDEPELSLELLETWFRELKCSKQIKILRH